MPQETERTRIGRLPERGVTDTKEIYEILDEGFVCHVGFSINAQPYVMPMVYGREGDQLYVHGAALSRLAKSLSEGIPVCVEVTLVDGLVLARSSFHHSVNYRSVVVVGRARALTTAADKMKALRCITNHVVPNRWSEARPPNAEEMAATTVLALPLDELSAKVRKGPPKDDESDMALPVWAGVLPLRTQMGDPVADKDVLPGVEAINPGRLKRFTS